MESGNKDDEILGGETKRSRNEQIEVFLRSRYSFRFNTIKCKPEFRRTDGSPFVPITKYDLNSFKREIDASIGLNTSVDNVRSILESDFSPKVNPIREYFEGLSALPDRPGSVGRLAATVQVANPGKWEEYLTKWLVGVVANAKKDTGCQNHVCLVLTGDQGRYKTSWLDNLCPRSLQSYLFTGKIDPQNKDVQTLIAEYLLINIDDQLKALNKRDENELKNMITAPSVKYRRPYDVYIEEYPHLASFMASVNGNDFLTDPTGSRRFLPFEVVEIDIGAAQALDMDSVWTEAVHLYKKKYRYWFDKDEVEELHTLNRNFQVQTVESEMLARGFVKPGEDDADCFMMTSQILSYLQGYTSVRLSEKRMGEALYKAGFDRTQKRIGTQAYPSHGWRIKKAFPVPFIDDY